MRTLSDIRNQRKANREHKRQLPKINAEIQQMLREAATAHYLKRSSRSRL